LRPFRMIIAGHGTFPAALLATAEMICGEIPDVAAVGLTAGETPDHYAESLRAAIGRDHGSGGSGHAAGSPRATQRVLVLCDLLGGTPFNVASAIARRSPRVTCVAGVNLPMVVEAALSEAPLDDELVEQLLEVGRTGIVETERHRARRVS
jgi:mannose/fructose/sorbose-specific phosphotransferase system IIA component